MMPVFDDKAVLAAREKRCIAEAAVEFVEPGDTVYLDGGSTVLELARLLAIDQPDGGHQFALRGGMSWRDAGRG